MVKHSTQFLIGTKDQPFDQKIEVRPKSQTDSALKLLKILHIFGLLHGSMFEFILINSDSTSRENFQTMIPTKRPSIAILYRPGSVNHPNIARFWSVHPWFAKRFWQCSVYGVSSYHFRSLYTTLHSLALVLSC